MIKVVVQENKEYSDFQLISKLKTNRNGFESIVDKLKEKGILVKEKGSFKFKFVGICIVDNKIIFINPKYLSDDMENQVVLRLLMEYSGREILDIEEEEYLSYDYKNDANILGTIDYILKDYFENGLYMNLEKILDINGPGRIDWNRTIERNSVIFNKKGQPVYTELVTWENNINNNFIITNIHKYIINQCFEKLNELGLLDIFNYEYLEFEINKEYDEEFMLSKLNKELNNQFEDRKVNILKAMISFINKAGSDAEDEPIILFGTKSFHVIWEKVNSYIFSNQYNTLSKCIPIPKWKTLKGKWIDSRKNKIRPDILKLYKENFMILDAKYYNIELNDTYINGNPESYDVVKQFTYQSAFENLKNDEYVSKIKTPENEKEIEKIRSSKKIINAFIYPKEIDQIYEILGFVKLDIFNLAPILNIYISPKIIFERYINNNKLCEAELDGFLYECERALKELNK